MSIKFEFFEAGCGDSILVSTSEGTTILIDGGLTTTYRKSIQRKLTRFKLLNKVIVTHIDNDHICGIIALIKDNARRKKIEELWFNSCDVITVNKDGRKVGTGQSLLLEKLLLKYNVKYRNDIYLSNNNNYSINQDVTLTLLSPREEDLDELKVELEKDEAKYCNGRKVGNVSNKKCLDKRSIDEVESISTKDNSINNKTSIAFILDYKDENRFLFLADAHINIINDSLKKLGFSKDNRLKVDFVKLSHHGSQNNINNEFLNLVETDKFVTLTDCSKFEHPDKETYSLILKHSLRSKNIEFIFNYKSAYQNKFTQEDVEKYNFTLKHKKEM